MLGGIEAPVDGELTASLLRRDELIRNKESTGRARDLADVEELRAVEQVRRMLGKPESAAS